MKNALLFIFYFVSVKIIFSQNTQTARNSDQPWSDSTFALIIDPYSENPIDFEKLVTDKRVVGIIHKATQGYSADKLYYQREFLARQKKLLWGSYHMGMAGDPIRQADFYLNTAVIDSTELMALDLEGLDTNTFMSLPNAEKFIRHVYEKTKRYPLLYCNNSVLEEISSHYSDTSVFAKCGLWYARYLKQLPDYNKKVWKVHTLWQFSCEVNCQETGKCWYNVPGTLYDMDVNVYNGSIEEIRERWPDITVYDTVASARAFSKINEIDLDGDKKSDRVEFDYTGGAHCCYKIRIMLSSGGQEYSYPFELDGGFFFGPLENNEGLLRVKDSDNNGAAEIFLTIQSYNGELTPIPKKWKKEYGISTNHIVIYFSGGRLLVKDFKPD